MRTFTEWMKEAIHAGRPYGQMGPDGKIYGWSGGPVSNVPGTNTWKTDSRPNRQEDPIESLWNSSDINKRKVFLNNSKLSTELATKQWHEIPQMMAATLKFAMQSNK